MPPVSISPSVDTIRDAVAQAGGRTHLVGGSLRDRLPRRSGGKPMPKDYDLMVTGLPMDRLQAAMPGAAPLVGASFPVIKARVGEDTIDIALPRTERSTGARHRDFEVVGDPNLPIPEDLARRDFTMNAIALCLDDGEMFDPFGGREDIECRWIRAVGDPAMRFREDPLRMLRAARFVAQLGFEIHPDTVEGLRRCAGLLWSVSKERIAEELLRLLACADARYVGIALRLLRDTGLLAMVCQPFVASFAFVQKNPYHHLTVDEHVFLAVEHAVSRGFPLRARLAVLLHDVGKPWSYTEKDGVGHFKGHEDVGSDIVRQWMRSMSFPTALTDSVALIVAEHLRPERDIEDKPLRRWFVRLGEAWDDALACREADLAAHAGHVAADAIQWTDGIRARIATIDKAVPPTFSEATLALTGTEIASRFGAKGIEIGRLKRLATQAVVDGEIPNEAEVIAAWLASHAPPGLGEQ